MMKKIGCCKNPSVGLFLIRLALATVFIVHGVQKLMNMDGIAMFFGNIGVPAPAVMAWVVALIETLGGAAMLLGAFTCYAGIGLAFVMAGALYFVKLSAEGITNGAYEFELTLLLASLAVVFAGPGKYALMRKCCGWCEGGKCDDQSHVSIPSVGSPMQK